MKANSDLRLFSLVHRPVITASLVMGEPSRGTKAGIPGGSSGLKSPEKRADLRAVTYRLRGRYLQSLIAFGI